MNEAYLLAAFRYLAMNPVKQTAKEPQGGTTNRYRVRNISIIGNVLP